MSDGHWTYAEWEDATVEKIVTMGLAIPEEHRADYLQIQIRSAIKQALRHGQAGLGTEAPVQS